MDDNVVKLELVDPEPRMYTCDRLRDCRPVILRASDPVDSIVMKFLRLAHEDVPLRKLDCSSLVGSDNVVVVAVVDDPWIADAPAPDEIMDLVRLQISIGVRVQLRIDLIVDVAHALRRLEPGLMCLEHDLIKFAFRVC